MQGFNLIKNFLKLIFFTLKHFFSFYGKICLAIKAIITDRKTPDSVKITVIFSSLN